MKWVACCMILASSPSSTIFLNCLNSSSSSSLSWSWTVDYRSAILFYSCCICSVFCCSCWIVMMLLCAVVWFLGFWVRWWWGRRWVTCCCRCDCVGVIGCFVAVWWRVVAGFVILCLIAILFLGWTVSAAALVLLFIAVGWSAFRTVRPAGVVWFPISVEVGRRFVVVRSGVVLLGGRDEVVGGWVVLFI